MEFRCIMLHSAIHYKRKKRADWDVGCDKKSWLKPWSRRQNRSAFSEAVRYRVYLDERLYVFSVQRPQVCPCGTQTED